MKHLKLLTLLTAFAGLLIIGCSKGNTGPAGANGAAGTPGAPGAPGAQGPAGAAGPDSVLHSAWIQLSMTAYTDTTTNTTTYSQDIAASGLTQAILDSGVVLSYISYVDQNGATSIINASNLLGVTYAAGSINLFSDVDDSYTITGWKFRYILVPSTLITGNSASGKTYTKQQLQNMSYQEIVKKFNVSAVNIHN